MIRLEMRNYSMILIEKLLKYPGKINKYEYLTGEDGKDYHLISNK